MTNDIIDAECTPIYEGALICRFCDWMEDWFVIDRRDHDHTRWYERTEYGVAVMCSSRISDADIEGTGAEMLAIADAITARSSESFRRCECIHVDGGFELSSPRNSSFAVFVPYTVADMLALDIRAAVADPQLHAGGETRELPSGEIGRGPEFTRRLKA